MKSLSFELECWLPLSLALYVPRIVTDFTDDTAEPGLTPEEIQMEVQKWVARCKIGAIVGVILFAAWIVLAQVLRGSVFPPSWYMLNQDDVTITGW
jgi:hypothetical protein